MVGLDQGYPTSVKKVGVLARSGCSRAAGMRRNTYFFTDEESNTYVIGMRHHRDIGIIALCNQIHSYGNS